MKHLLILMVALPLVISGCGGGGGPSGPDETKSLSDCKAEAVEMSVADLRTTIANYQRALAGKQAELRALQTQSIEKNADASIAEKSKAAGSSMGKLLERSMIYAAELMNKDAVRVRSIGGG
ncbi:MAG: hypothetical protein HN909_01050 [Phycisphaerales bacterium]|jgi:hypothetical protein|nr:hypothetical protein [Phycisphaerales bacterium]MBT7170336.1 hypothetical protein [Phycisphaerales bacterium]